MRYASIRASTKQGSSGWLAPRRCRIRTRGMQHLQSGHGRAAGGSRVWGEGRSRLIDAGTAA